MTPVGVMQVVDALEAGGAERFAVNLANHLPRAHFRSYLCTTRHEGPLAPLLRADVGRLRLERRRTVDLSALRRLVRYVRDEQIGLLHAHGTALFFSALAKFAGARCKLIWEDQFGACQTHARPAWLYRLATGRADGAIAVNQTLVNWSKEELRIPRDRVWYVPNFVDWPEAVPPAVLGGTAGRRLVCTANLRPQKDHPTLLRALATVRKAFPDVRLFLAGAEPSREYASMLRGLAQELGLDSNVEWLGRRDDVPAILRGCDIGVLSSSSEGLPLAVLEYGFAGLPVVATRVGQCAEVLEDGAAGVLVPPGDPQALGAALVSLLNDPARGAALASRLHQRTKERYSAGVVIPQICRIYDTVLDG